MKIFKNKNKTSSDSNESLSLATWIMLIISFSLLGYALYIIQTRIIENRTRTEIKTPEVKVVKEVAKEQ